MEQLLKDLGINYKGEFTDNNTYVVDLPDSSDFGKVFSLLDKSDLLEPDDESSQVTADVTSVQYVNDEFTLTLLGDLENDTYKLTLRQN